MSIELRFSDIPPPTPEPPRTIYRDLIDLPDPTKLGVTIRYYNFDSVTLYFQITAACAGYTFGTVNLGSLGAGLNAYMNLDEFGSKAKPASETQETIVFTLKAFTDAGYSNLKWTYVKNVDVVWIKSDDPSYTLDVNNNFDDGTVQGWAYTVEVGNTVNSSFGVATDYVLSTPYSLRAKTGDNCPQNRFRVSKTFNTPNKSKIYMIANVRLGFLLGSTPGTPYTKTLMVQFDSTVQIFLGKPYDSVAADYVPRDKWLRIVVPLPPNQSVDIRLVFEAYATCFRTHPTIWLDDFKMISKD